jgi:hypothetical protein
VFFVKIQIPIKKESHKALGAFVGVYLLNSVLKEWEITQFLSWNDGRVEIPQTQIDFMLPDRTEFSFMKDIPVVQNILLFGITEVRILGFVFVRKVLYGLSHALAHRISFS